MTTTTTTRGRSKRRSYNGPSPEEKLAADLVALMEAGTSPWQRPWDAAAGEHRNLLTGHQYRGGNPLLLEVGNLTRGNTLPLWIGAGQAKAHGWHPAKGSKAARIAQPIPIPERRSEHAEPGEVCSTDRPGFVMYRLVPVFNAADLAPYDDAAGADLARRIEAAMGGVEARPEHERLEHAESVLERWSVPTQFGGALACYSPALDRISMPARSAFTSAATFCATWAHEQVHSTGHKARLNRNMAGSFGTPSYAREELVAELGAALVCRRLQIDHQPEHHASYLANWCEVLREEPKAIMRALGQAVKAANLIAPEAAPKAEGQEVEA